jgi:hypothetical protein
VGIADDICEFWGWMGIESAQVVQLNKFGNVVFADQTGKYWRICPEELKCKPIAESAMTYEHLLNDSEFVNDWEMARLVEIAEAKYGTQPVGRCFCLKIPGILGGAYGIENIGTISIGELIRFSGDVAHQIKDLPSGSKIEFKIVD